MQITVISDIHGSLIPIEKTDLLIIAGDWSPLEIQTKILYMKEWMGDYLVPWFSEIEADKIIFIAGNHDFICEKYYAELPLFGFEFSFEKDVLKPILKKHNIINKVKYLENNSTKYKGYKIYGCPYVENCTGWAFSNAKEYGIFGNIPKCDILVTHQAPDYNGLGTTKIQNKQYNFGSLDLLERIKQTKPEYVFCGHIHGGNHKQQELKYDNNKSTKLFNVSIKDEDYEIRNKPLILNIEDKKQS